MAQSIPITNMSPGLHADVDARLVPAGACVRGMNTRHHLGTIRVREGRVQQLALPVGLAAAAKLLVEYRTQTDPISRLLLVAGDALYGTPTANATGWYQSSGVDTPLLTASGLFNGTHAVQSAGYNDYQYFVDALNNVLKWRWGDQTPIRLTDLPKPLYAPDIAINNTPVTLATVLASETWSTMTGFMPTPVYRVPTDSFYSYGTEPYGYGVQDSDLNNDNNGVVVRPFSVDASGNPWADGLSHNGLELLTTSGLFPMYDEFKSQGWMEIEFPFSRLTGTYLDLSNSNQLHLQFELVGSETPSSGRVNNPYPAIYLQLGSYAAGDLAHNIPVSYTGIYGGVIDAYVSLVGISSTDLASVQFIAIKVDANQGGCPTARFDTAGYAGETSSQSLSSFPIAITLVLLKLEANSLTSNFMAGNVYNVYTTFLYADPHDSTPSTLPMLESDVSPLSSLTLDSETFLNPSGMSVAQGILPGSNSSTSPATPCNCAPVTITPPRDLTALEYNGALPASINIYASGGEWGAIVKLVGNIPITDALPDTGILGWAVTTTEIDETLGTDLDGMSVYTTPDGLAGPEITPYSSAPPSGCSLITEWQGRMVYGAADMLYVSAWDNPDLIAPVAVTDATGTLYGTSAPVGLDGFPLTGFGHMGTYLIVFKNRSKWLFTGSDASTFNLQLLPGNEGCSSPKSICEVPGAGLIWRDGIHIWLMGGDFIPKDIADTRIATLLAQQSGQTLEAYNALVLLSYAYYDPVELQYVLVVPASATGDNQATAYAFEMRTQSWDTPFTGYPGGCAARMELLTTPGTYAADTALTGYVTRLGEGLTDEGNAIPWQWVSAAITGPDEDWQKDVRQLSALCSYPALLADSLYLLSLAESFYLRLYANGALVSYASKLLAVELSPGETGYVKFSPKPCSNLLSMQAGLSGVSSTGGEVVEVAFDVEVKGVR